MYSIIADTHTHTTACDHAFSILSENVASAGKAGLKALALTEHGPKLTGSPSFIHFHNLRVLPRYMNDILLLRGAEVNIVDFSGALDLEDEIIAKLEWVIASFHMPVIKPSTVKDHTEAWIKIANNPHIDVIGHCGSPRYPFEHEPVIKEIAGTGKIVEINNNSFLERPGSGTNCKAIAVLCAEYGVPVVLNSDAHYCEHIGKVDGAVKILNEIGFPEELVLNADYDRFIAAVNKINGKPLD